MTIIQSDINNLDAIIKRFKQPKSWKEPKTLEGSMLNLLRSVSRTVERRAVSKKMRLHMKYINRMSKLLFLIMVEVEGDSNGK